MCDEPEVNTLCLMVATMLPGRDLERKELLYNAGVYEWTCEGLYGNAHLVLTTITSHCYSTATVPSHASSMRKHQLPAPFVE
jgi:hypothetical protein